MGLVNNNAAQAKQRTAPNEVLVLATRIQKSLRDVGRGVGARYATWVRELRLCLANECGGDAARLSRVWEWYCDNFKNTALRLPNTFSASGLRKWFHVVEERMGKGQKGRKLEMVSVDAAHAAKAATVIGFPPLMSAMLETHAQVCIDRYSPIRIKLIKWVDEKKKEHAKHPPNSSAELSLVSAAEKLLAFYFSAPKTFAANYLKYVGAKLRTWTEYVGDYSNFLFDPNGDYFAHQCSRVLQGYAGANAGNLWFKLKGIML